MRAAPADSPGFGSLNPPSNRGMFGAPPVVNNNRGGRDSSRQPAANTLRVRPRETPFTNSYEYIFKDSTLAAVADTVGLPVYVSTAKGVKAVLLEADLYDYPNLFAKASKSNTLSAVFPPYVVEDTTGANGQSTVADYIARTTGNRSYPWRALAISPDDKGLLENQLVYKLSSAPAIASDWIKPGQVSWDWWHGSNLYDVDFKAGINTASYKYYADFASRYGIPYILIDAGWRNNPEVDIPAISTYAAGKNVGVMLWMAWTDLKANIKVLDSFQTWGIKGVKMDYMNRADQGMVNFFEEVARQTAAHKLLIDFHGAFKPVGLNRKYPNVVNYESVKGAEHNKLGSTHITPSHDVTILFTRMVAGQLDYTPGAMNNATSANFRNISSEPMSQGTRAHQASMYILYDAPLQMLADNPSTYLKEDAYKKFLTSIPTVWDTTIAIDGKIGQYAIMARKKGNNWYIGAMSDWSERNFDIALPFLDDKKYKVTIVEDGINADRHPADYKIVLQELLKSDKLNIKMARGGGWAAVFEPAP